MKIPTQVLGWLPFAAGVHLPTARWAKRAEVFNRQRNLTDSGSPATCVFDGCVPVMDCALGL